MTAAATTEKPSEGTWLGMTSNRVRGILAFCVLFGIIYFTIFESDPPPVFSEVEIEIPPKPTDSFSEKTIVLPDFDESPVVEEDTETDGVDIATVTQQEQPVVVAEEPSEGAVEPNPDGVGLPADDEVSILETEPEPEPPPVAIVEPAPEVTTGTGFYVQVAAVSDEDNATAIAASLQEILAEPTFVQEVNRNGNLLYRVRIGPYGEDEGKANEVLNRLRTQATQLGASAFVDED